MSKRSNKAEFSAKARKIIEERDNGCIFCKMGYQMQGAGWMDLNTFSIMHYIPRSRGGLGIEQNGAVGCSWHHTMLDNGKDGRRKEMLGMFSEYLMQQYSDWNESKLTYSKWDFLNVE